MGMTQDDKIIGVFGGTGFLGHAIINDLARAGFRVKVMTRHPESCYELKPYGNVGQIVPYFCNYKEEGAIDKAIEGCDAVINLIGILFEKGKNSFEKAHVRIPEEIAKACKKHKVERLLHVSALGIDENKSKYAQTKLKGEEAIKEAFPSVTIFRPSVVFGPDDSFFNMFAQLSTLLPALPLIGGGKTKFQPVYVGDIAEAALKVMQDTSDGHAGKIYEMGGPDIVTFKEIYEILLKETDRKRALIPVPWPIATLKGKVMSILPKPPLTGDQVKSLRHDNILSGKYQEFSDLGMTPTPMDVILPQYLSTYRRGGRFADKKAS
ncbi:MAG: complex I NDUFA9 subunit family protein [Pseudomonadota bacterium]